MGSIGRIRNWENSESLELPSCQSDRASDIVSLADVQFESTDRASASGNSTCTLSFCLFYLSIYWSLLAWNTGMNHRYIQIQDINDIQWLGILLVIETELLQFWSQTKMACQLCRKDGQATCPWPLKRIDALRLAPTAATNCEHCDMEGDIDIEANNNG